jgi:hypothetical protein
MLENQIDRKNNSWAIRWHASLFLAGQYCIQPTRTLVRNIGLDNTGVHCGPVKIEQNPVSSIEVRLLPIMEADWFFDAYKKNNSEGNKWLKLKDFLKRLYLRF